MRAGASIAKEIVRRIDELFAIERDISGKPPTNGEPRTRNGRSRWFSRLRPICGKNVNGCREPFWRDNSTSRKSTI